LLFTTGECVITSYGWKQRICLLSLLCSVTPLVASPVLRVLTEDNPPFSLQVSGGLIDGISTRIVREMFLRAAEPYRIELEPWMRAFNSALHDPNTCVYSTIRTASREHQFKWVGPLVETPWALFARARDGKVIESLDAVRHAVIGGYSGDAVAQYLVNNGFNVEFTSSDLLNMRKLAAGRIDYWATGKIRGQYLIAHEKQPQLKALLVFNSSFMYLACNNSVPDLSIRRWNEVLRSMQRDGFINQVQKTMPDD
jgi:polar amino acid transport system substrate-binding protein